MPQIISLEQHDRYIDGSRLDNTYPEPVILGPSYEYNAERDPEARTAQVKQGETLLDIASRVYVQQYADIAPQLFYALAYANDILDPFDLTDREGENIIVPSLEVLRASLVNN